MNNLDHVKNFYPENYKLDLSETMKAALSKGPAPSGSGVGGPSAGVLGSGSGNSMGGAGAATGVSHGDLQQGNPNAPGIGYVTEKLYMLLQLYLQNKGWNPSAELLQCFTDLKDNALLPSAAYLQVLANRLTLDAQGRLILRENGKIVLPFEHFANAVMLKHMSGPHGLHLSVDATVRAVIESYTIGRENFGMEKEFIIEVVQSCPSPACRYYKNHIGMSPMPFMDQQFPGVATDFLQHLPHLPPPPPHPLAAGGSVGSGGNGAGGGGSSGSSSVGSVSSTGCSGEVDLTKPTQSHSQPKMPPQLQHLTKQQQNSIQSQLSQLSAAAAAAAAAAQQSQREREQQQAVAVAAAAAAAHHQQQLQQQAQQQAAAAAAAAAAKQQQQQAQQQAAAAAAAAQQQQQQLTAALIQQQNRALAQQSLEKFSNLSSLEKQRILQQLDPKHFDPMAVAAAAANLQMMQSQAASVAAAAAAAAGSSSASSSTSSTSSTTGGVSGGVALTTLNNHHAAHQHSSVSSASAHLPPPSQSPTVSSAHSSSSSSSTHSMDQLTQKSVVEALRSNLESLESNKDLLALHNGAWSVPDNREALALGQDKIVRVFTELMRNMARMKSYIRPSMCKPYGKQSESLQKTLMDTIQVVQTLRNCLPAPHIPVTSWKSESEKPAGVGAAGGVVTGVPGSVVAGNGTGNLQHSPKFDRDSNVYIKILGLN